MSSCSDLSLLCSCLLSQVRPASNIRHIRGLVHLVRLSSLSLKLSSPLIGPLDFCSIADVAVHAHRIWKDGLRNFKLPQAAFPGKGRRGLGEWPRATERPRCVQPRAILILYLIKFFVEQ